MTTLLAFLSRIGVPGFGRVYIAHLSRIGVIPR